MKQQLLQVSNWLYASDENGRQEKLAKNMKEALHAHDHRFLLTSKALERERKRKERGRSS